MNSPLAKMQQQQPLSEIEIFNKKREGWRKEETLVVTKRQREKLSMLEHDAVISIGNKLYGKGGG